MARVKPERVSDLEKLGHPWAFLSTSDIKGDCEMKNFKVKASKTFENGVSMFVVFLTNLIPAQRIWEALRMRTNLELLKKALQFDSLDKKNCNGCLNLYESAEGNLAKNLSSSLNESQTRAVLSCLHMLKCERNPAFELIWDPLGTGMTKTISSLLVALLARNGKILVCARENGSITEVASQVVKMVSDERNGSLFCSLGDILLVGTKERLKVGSDVEAVHLDHRREKLADCFRPFNSMIDLLKKCVSLYHGEAEKKNNPNHSFLGYFRERFNSVFTELECCINIICTHVPEAYITRSNIQHIKHVISLFSSFQSLLLQDGLISELLEKAFSPSEDTGAFSSDEDSLSSKKKECLCVLITVRDCLSGLGFSSLKSYKSIETFCYQRASLIFCTVSCSSKLHKTEFKPTILVINNAAQLKESESTIPLQLPGLKHAILVGNECQLPETVLSKVSKKAGFGRSLFERLSLQNHPKHLLSVQCRSYGREMNLLSPISDQQKEIILFQRSAYVLGRSGTGKTSVLIMKLFHGLENSGFKHVDPGQTVEKKPPDADEKVLRQLFVTSDPRQCNLIKQHLSSLRQSGYLAGSKPSDDDEIDYEETEFTDGFCLDSYPLIITFRQFLLMLDGALTKSFFERLSEKSKVSQSSKPKEVDRERFSSHFWPLFDTRFTKKLDPSTVFTEITCRIKGGTQSIEACNGKISRKEYVTSMKELRLGLSRKRRETIYDLFRVYEETKMKNGEFDVADLVNDLHDRLKHAQYKGEAMDFVYVDDVQRLTMTQFALFAHVCENVETGFFFSGDTLKENASSAAFRIRDMRSLFHKSFVQKIHEGGQPTSMFNLTQNFQAHSGVMKLSQSIVELLYHFFPLSIDIVEPETTSMTGDLPVLLHHEDFITKLFGDNSSGFGADQVIMVRDECERMKIKDRIGNRALVLTMAECQDLEFEDVLLYNFFGSSPLKTQWVIINKYMKDHGSFDPTIYGSQDFELDNSKYNILLSELKRLYIAISKTRQRLWIWDNDEVSKPMFEFWKAKSLVQADKLNDSLAREMKSSSASKDWKSRGIKLYHKHKYEMATMCFEKADDSVWETKCRACSLVVKADSIRSLNPEEANSLLSKAAEMYNDIDEDDSAAKCFELSGDFEKVGIIYSERSSVSELRKSGECFSLSGCYNMAAEVYAKANLFSECLNVCVKGKLFDVGFEYLLKWKQSSQEKSEEEEMKRSKQEFLETCAVHYYEVNDRKSMMKVVEEFVSMDLTRDFLKSNGCLDELVSLEEKLGNLVGAVEIARLKGDELLVADLLGKAMKFGQASTVILSHVLSDSLWSSGKSGWPLVHFENKDKLLAKAMSFAMHMPREFLECVRAEVTVLKDNTRDLNTLMNQMKDCQRHESIAGKIVSARRIVDAHLDSNPAMYLWGETEVISVISNDRVSVDSLVYFWSIWKKNIIKVLKYLRRVESRDSIIGKHGDFCMSFLGVRRQIEGSGEIYTLLNSDASWAQNAEKKSVQSSTNLVCIDSCQFVYAARSYWSTEVNGVGFKVFRKLVDLSAYVTPKVELVRGKCSFLIYVHEMVKKISESEFLRRTHEESESLQRLITLLIDKFFGYVSPLDRRKDFTEHIAEYRGTASCENFLKQVVVDYPYPGNNLCHGNIGSIAMIILGSRKLSNEMYKKVLGRMANQKNPSWNEFFTALSLSERSWFPSLDLVLKCQEALSNSYKARFEVGKECISPECFVYLLERLLIWASSFRGYFVTSRSSFVEWLVHENIGKENRSIPDLNPKADLQVSLMSVLHFMIDAVQKCLRDKAQMIEWIEQCGKKADEFYSPLVIRMVVIVCLLHANFGMCLDFLYELLGKSYISVNLPPEFCNAIKSRFLLLNLDVLADAFQELGDPLVVVILRNDCPRISLPIVVDLNCRWYKTSIVRILFPRKSDCTSSSITEINDADSSIDLINFWRVYEDVKAVGAEASKMVEIQKHIKMFKDAICSFPLDHEVEQSILIISIMIEEMELLDAALTSMDQWTAQELSKKLQSRRPRMDKVLEKILLQKKKEKAGCHIQ